MMLKFWWGHKKKDSEDPLNEPGKNEFLEVLGWFGI